MLATRMRMGAFLEEWALVFSGGNERVVIPADETLENAWDGGGYFTAKIRVHGIGGGSYGRIFDNDVPKIYTAEQSGSTCKLRFNYRFSGTDGEWTTTNRVITYNTEYLVTVIYNPDSIENNAVIYLDGNAQTMTRDRKPSGTRTSDVGQALFFGERASALGRGFDGRIYNVDYCNVAKFLMNEGGGSTVYDRRNSNDGTITGATWLRIK